MTDRETKEILQGNTPKSFCVNSFSHGLNHTVWNNLRSYTVLEGTRCSDIMVLGLGRFPKFCGFFNCLFPFDIIGLLILSGTVPACETQVQYR